MKEDREHLILLYLQGNLPPEERHAFESWRKESDENRKLVDDLRHIWQMAKDNEPPKGFHSDQEWEKIKSSLFDKEETPVRKLNPFGKNWLKIAATFLLVCLSSVVLYHMFFQSDSHVIISAENTVHKVLPDGSEVWLNAESQLLYNNDFEKNREVSLKGEAYFDVKKDTRRPFTIRTSDAMVKVLGTSFNVRACESEVLTAVSVMTGKVSMKANNGEKNIILTPGATGILSRSNHQLTIDTEEDLNRLAWKNKELIFKKTPLRTVVKTLSVYFKKDFRVKNKELLYCRFTGSFKDPSLDEVLESISLALDLKMKHQEDIYIFDGTGCKEN